ncbi:hypothetical protein D778_00175 [Xanthomarina gelatinilytica]|uniref:Sporadically distributed protein, TIGR04141 family n=1 Tax=Xanthomarina gelatinilytica TaxID=1137281 RepID=M7MJE3_9FLAO|nr:DUF6119 family protein [Xanthomarina gelatinilytica]EMQ94990.1 hypothetical protein D778_00175 [Xanthomarina gelatinilytica]
MIAGQTRFNLKIFQIDKSYYEFKEATAKEIIEIIQNNHEKKLRHKFGDLDLIKPEVTYQKDDNFQFWSYCYNQPKEKYYWKLFLPENLTENQNFEIIEFSFVLFIKYKKEIYCVISGSGMSVIRKFINPSFGIDLYQRIAKPKEDVIQELEIRGVANNISQKKQIFNFNQTIAETLEYSEVPTKIKLQIRDDLKKNEFKKYSLGNDIALMEVGSYFSIRKKLNFDELKVLIKDIHKIRKNNKPEQLTLFFKVNEPDVVSELDETLKEIIVDDILLHNTPDRVKHSQSDVIEVVHPSKLERFYECNNFLIRAKYSRGKNDIVVKKRDDLYFECTKHIFDNLEDIRERPKIKGKLYTLNIVGHINKSEITYGHFFSHITAEIDYLGRKYFKIDGHWYLLDDDFLELMNNDAKEYYTKYRLKDDLLLEWPKKKDEDYYNKSHNHLENYFVLDKVITDNIELCDLLIVTDSKVHFVHVKNGFNTKMRDLYIQVILSAKRLSNDLKDNKKSAYLEKTLKLYNKRNPTKKIAYKDLVERLRKDRSQVNFVMAFKNNNYKDKSILERIDLCKSNIAKYALVQVVKEMQQYKFGIELFDISDR